MKRFLLALFVSGIFLFTAQAQMVINTSTTPTQLVNNFILTGVTASNIVYTGGPNSMGSFTGGNTTNLGLSNGIILSTGIVNSTPAINSAASYFSSNQTVYPGGQDADLQNLIPSSPIYDACVLEFDLVPAGNVLEFQYVFASEEYPEYVCSQFNDVFGFFISGPDPAGGNYVNLNIAQVPNSSLPVAINTINSGTPINYPASGCMSVSNSQYYVDNTYGTSIVYDGFTTVMLAQATVVPGLTYHLKMAIADVSDGIYDSGIFLKAQSMKSYMYVGVQENETHNFSIAPNPLSSDSKLSLNLGHPGKVKISITDISGKTVYQTEKSFDSAGPQQISLDEFNSNHTSGIFMMKVETDDFTEMQKIVK